VIITVCDSAAGETCPVWPGRPITAHWGIPDPAAVTGAPTIVSRAFDEAYWQLFRRIALFLALPFATLDPPALKAKLMEIARTADTCEHG
jgi:arsenate reductase